MAQQRNRTEIDASAGDRREARLAAWHKANEVGRSGEDWLLKSTVARR
jgi:hypothetical protein